jgi:hypothetical protein
VGGALLVMVLGMVLASGIPSLIGIVFYSVITEKGCCTPSRPCSAT